MSAAPTGAGSSSSGGGRYAGGGGGGGRKSRSGSASSPSREGGGRERPASGRGSYAAWWPRAQAQGHPDLGAISDSATGLMRCVLRQELWSLRVSAFSAGKWVSVAEVCYEHDEMTQARAWHVAQAQRTAAVKAASPPTWVLVCPESLLEGPCGDTSNTNPEGVVLKDWLPGQQHLGQRDSHPHYSFPPDPPVSRGGGGGRERGRGLPQN